MEPKKEPSATMIYVSNLPFTTTDQQLRDLFTGFEVKSAYVAKRRSGRSKGFGFVNLAKESDQKLAIQQVDQKDVDGRKLAVKIAFNDERRDEKGELKEEFKKQLPPKQGGTPSETVVYVSNLPWSFADEDLKKVFTGLEVKVSTVAKRRNGKSKGFGFVEFATKEDQQKALTHDQSKIEERVIAVKPSVNYRGPNQERPQQPRNQNNNNQIRRPRNQSSNNNNNNNRRQGGRSQQRNQNTASGGRKYFITHSQPYTLYVGNLPFDLDSNDLRQIFNEFNVKSTNVAQRPNGRSKGFGFVEFNNAQDQQEALQALDQSEVNSRVISVKISNNRQGGNNDNRRNNSRPRGNNSRQGGNNDNRRNNSRPRGNNSRQGGSTNRRRNRSNDNREPSPTMVYVSNLPFSVNDNGLGDIFKGLKVVKAYVATRQNGKSKGFGFVEFQSTEEQQKALKVNGNEVEGRPLVVQVAKKVENREIQEKK